MMDVAMEREMAKPLGVRAVAAHAGCCVFLCFCVLSWTELLANRLAAINEGKITNTQTLLHCKYKATTEHPYIIRCPGVK
jgi:hypothetical protein